MPSQSNDPLDEDLEKEIQDALGETSLMGLSRSKPTEHKPHRLLPDEGGKQRHPDDPGGRKTGTFRVGTVVGLGRDEVFLEFGPREQGIVPLIQFSENPEVGQTLKVRVDSYDGKEDLLLCSVTRAIVKAPSDWDALEAGSIVQGVVRAVNKGGLEIQVGLLSAFCPASHVSLERVEDLSTFVGRSLPFEVVEVDREKRRLVVSRRGILGRERDERRVAAVKSLAPGSVVNGTIMRIEPYGAFVDVGGVEGLLHVSQVSWKRLEKPDEVLKKGDSVKVQVLEVSEDGKRISLSMKVLTEDPWLRFTREHPAGSVMEGKITRLASYGAFVEIGEGVEGLAHVSQLSSSPVNHPKDVVREGATVAVRIVNVDPAQHRIGLSLLTERGDRLTDDVADDRTIREVLEREREKDRSAEPTLGDLLKRAMSGGLPSGGAAPKKRR